MRAPPLRPLFSACASLGLTVAMALPASAMIATSVIRDVIRDALPQLGECAAGAQPSVGGRIVVSFLVGPEGRVHEAEVTTNETGSPPLAECVTRIVLALEFPPTGRGGSIRVNYPFRFEALP